VFLRVTADEGPLFAAVVPDSADHGDLERRTNGAFVDMRAAMFLGSILRICFGP
jgi:hypothetical protein